LPERLALSMLRSLGSDRLGGTPKPAVIGACARVRERRTRVPTLE